MNVLLVLSCVSCYIPDIGFDEQVQSGSFLPSQELCHGLPPQKVEAVDLNMFNAT